MHRRNVGFWAEMGSRRRGVEEPPREQDFEAAVLLVLETLANDQDTLVHCKQGKHRSGAFRCFIVALVLNKDFVIILDDYLKTDLLPHDRKYLVQVVFECNLHARMEKARADKRVKRILDTISEKVERRGVEESAERVEKYPEKYPGTKAKQRPKKAVLRPASEVEAAAHPKLCLQPVPTWRPRPRPPATPPPAFQGNKRLQEAIEKRKAKMARSSSSSSSNEGQGVVGSSYEWRPGDWQCKICNNWNKNCRAQCHFAACPGATWKPGDWTCTVCGNHNWASREVCAMRKCGARRRV